jgi:hypothetical protein
MPDDGPYCWCGHQEESHSRGACLGCAEDPGAMEPGGTPWHDYEEAT